jgi:hypothetical protein
MLLGNCSRRISILLSIASLGQSRLWREMGNASAVNNGRARKSIFRRRIAESIGMSGILRGDRIGMNF